MVLGTKVAPFPYFMWGKVTFTACLVFSFHFLWNYTWLDVTDQHPINQTT